MTATAMPSLTELVAPYLNKAGPASVTRDPLNETAIRYFCEVVQDANPVYWDDEAARASVFGRIIAPPQALWSLSFRAWWSPDYVDARNRDDARRLGDEATDTSRAMAIISEHGYTAVTVVDQEMEYLSPFGPGDGRIISRGSLISVSEPKPIRVGEAVFIVSQTDYSVESDGRAIGRQRSTMIMYNPDGPKRGDSA